LIEIENRYDKKQIVINDSEDFDVVLSVKLFDEGTDWVQAESVIDLCPSNSLRIQVQRFGRLLRDIVGKTHIDYNVFLPYESKFKDDEERRLHMSRSFNAFTASCLLHEAIEPVLKPVVKNNVESKLQPLSEIGINDSKKQDLITKVIKDLMFLKNLVNNPSISESKECIINSIKDFGIKTNIDEIVEHVVKTLRRSSIPKSTEWESQTIDISWMIERGFDKVWSDDIFDNLLSFGTGICGIKTFEEFRNIYSLQLNISEHVKNAEKLAKENRGKLYTITKLYKMGESSLACAIRKKPEYFSHIVRDYDKIKVIQHVQLAEKLAKKNNGVLPAFSVLIRMGYATLADSIRRVPDKYKHIKREVLRLTVQDHIINAEKLAKENGGFLPPTKELKKSHKALFATICNHRKKFMHLIKPNGRLSVDEHVKNAEKLAKKNKGVLYKHAKLKSLNFHSLSQSIYANPKKFQHIKMETNDVIDPKIRIKQINKLIKENNGKFPCCKELADANKYSLYTFFRSHREKFKDVKIKRFRKSFNDHLKRAEEISNLTNGILCSRLDLLKIGESELVHCINNYRDKFSHLKLDVNWREKRKTIEIHMKDAEKMASENNGKLPKKIYDQRLYSAIFRNPDKFKHIPREV